MCKHMGAGAPGFAEVGEHFHRTADTIAEAARRHDRAGRDRRARRDAADLRGCHDSYRQEIVDDATFAKTAGSSGMDPSCPMMKHGT